MSKRALSTKELNKYIILFHKLINFWGALASVAPPFLHPCHVLLCMCATALISGSYNSVDEDCNLLKFGNHKSILMRKGPAWPYLHINEECWYCTATDHQGTGVIDGNY